MPRGQVRRLPTSCLTTLKAATTAGPWKGRPSGRSRLPGTLDTQQTVSGFPGKGLVNSFLGGDGPTGQADQPAVHD